MNLGLIFDLHRNLQAPNAGAVGRSLSGDVRASYVTLELSSKHVELKRLEYDVDRTVNVIGKSGMPSIVAALSKNGVRRMEDLGYVKS